MTLSAAAVGVSPRAFYRRRRTDPAFAREYRLALQCGYERIELALLEAGVAGSHEHDDWRRNDPPAMPPMTANQGLQLLYLHQKEARCRAEPWPIRKLRGESSAVHCLRLAIMAEAEDQKGRDEFELAEAEAWAAGEPAWGPAGAEVREKLGLPDATYDWMLPDDTGGEASSGVNPLAVDPHGHAAGGRPGRAVSRRTDARSAPLTVHSAAAILPDLAQVTGWSRADPEAVAADDSRALFGGWRIEEMEAVTGEWGVWREGEGEIDVTN